ncbi:glycoside hydrolase family 99-like domain-containing protein [Niabella drilacis]|uniref:Glycosyltransferase WbsX n=1 Tax=Niabella drilacis (strain DSM 25811 / CCM 8410 / CCUG 62505 / LMG 26954 / E90) TaxID=1285928 RepID=A0A1G6X0C6_NIADE|nr:glycoside hydrolase family 99-like domain-containing protein [Niabella drilacis]SDD71622.1 Glycosyltransferase WbsX [Niabella drilacis]
MKKLFFLVHSMLFFCGSCSHSQVKAPPVKDNAGKVRVGAWYFGGWSFPPDDAAGHTFHISPTLVSSYAEREPVWGWREDAPGVMKDQIRYAHDAGLSFWGFCWYENSLVANSAYMDNLNKALDLFLSAPNKNELDFFLLSCHPVSAANWETVCNRTVRLFKEPNYLKVEGRPIIVFFNTDEVIKGLGGEAGTKAAFARYRQQAKAAGAGDLLIGARTIPSDPTAAARIKASGFDFITTYNNADDGRLQPGENGYQNLVQGDRKVWTKISAASDLPYVPTLGAGYDMRPWAKDHPAIPASDYWYTGVTPQKLAGHLTDAVNWAQQNRSKVLGGLLFIYAWNENGEGSWLTPTKKEGAARLDAIKKVLAK